MLADIKAARVEITVMFCGIRLLYLVRICSIVLLLWFYCWSAAALCVLFK